MRSRLPHRILFPLLALGLACGGGIDHPGTVSIPPLARPDAGAPGAGQTDAGSPPDAGGVDPGSAPDSGTPDAGSPPEEGTPDAGVPDSGTPPSDAGSMQLNPFGVREIYPTAPGGETWFLSDDPLDDPRFIPQDEITRNADGSWKMRSSKVRMEVTTSTGYHPSDIATYDREELAGKGYMQSPNDWKNVEMTGFVRINAASDPHDNFCWYARGGRHSDSIGCEGSAYKGGLHYDGRTRWEKESWHVDYDQSPYQDTTSSLFGRWVGFKAVMRNITVDGMPAVKLELWLNDDADKVTWKKVYDWTDDGHWGGNASHCGGADDAMPITWGGPLATFRWDDATDVDFKWLSVREIE